MLERSIAPRQIWRHFKGGIYTIDKLGICSTTMCNMVVYTKENEEFFWIRPIANFLEKIEFEGKEVYRFDRIE